MRRPLTAKPTRENRQEDRKLSCALPKFSQTIQSKDCWPAWGRSVDICGTRRYNNTSGSWSSRKFRHTGTTSCHKFSLIHSLLPKTRLGDVFLGNHFCSNRSCNPRRNPGLLLRLCFRIEPPEIAILAYSNSRIGAWGRSLPQIRFRRPAF